MVGFWTWPHGLVRALPCDDVLLGVCSPRGLHERLHRLAEVRIGFN